MKIIKSSVKILDNDWSVKGIFRAIERAGRTCYKSVGTRYFRLVEEPENSLKSNLIKRAQNDSRVVCKKGADFDPAYYISIPNKFINDYSTIEQFDEENFEDSPYYENLTAEDFVNRLVESKHGAMLEHGTVYMQIDTFLDIPEDKKLDKRVHQYDSNRFTKVNSMYIGQGCWRYYITTNLRVLVENNWLDDLKYVCEPTEYHAKRVMVRFICDRITSQSIVRHRTMSFAQESTRYCNYSKDKFGHELVFIEPSWEFPTSDTVNVRERFEAMLNEAEANYMELIALGCKPQEARSVLLSSIKTEIVVTGFIDDWKHFFELRCDNAAHPDIRKLALDLQKQFRDRELI